MSKLNQTGSTLIELLIYVSLLALITTIIFSYAWQINSQNQKILGAHSNLHTIYTALDRLIYDLKISDKIEIKASHAGLKKQSKTVLVCKTADGVISWQINQEFSLLRTEQQNKLHKKAVTAKVAENIRGLDLRQTKLKNGNTLVKVKLYQRNTKNMQKNKFEKQVLLRKSASL